MRGPDVFGATNTELADYIRDQVCCPRIHGCELGGAAECPAERVRVALGASAASPESLSVSQDEPSPTHVAEATATEAQNAGQWVLVPREPTEAMIAAAVESLHRPWREIQRTLDAYRAMIAAAPAPPAAPPSPAPPSSEREGSRAGDRS